jgi:hypothetical protein
MWAIGIVVSDFSFHEYRVLPDALVPITVGKFFLSPVRFGRRSGCQHQDKRGLL